MSHCFNINFKNDPNIEGINNIILAYRESLSKVELASPTFFSYVIDKVIKEVKYDMQHNRQENHYYILLIYQIILITPVFVKKLLKIEKSSQKRI